MPRISEGYRDSVRTLHASERWGDDGARHADKVAALVSAHGARTLLDYGCGRGTLKSALNKRVRVDVTEYDPGVPGKDVLPKGEFDIVVSTDVLEHIEPQYVEETLSYLAAAGRRAAFLTVCCRPARMLLPDGRNAHLTIQPHNWWYDRLRAAFPNAKFLWNEATYSFEATIVPAKSR